MNSPRIASDSNYFPYGWPGKLVCYIHISEDAAVSQMTCRDDLRAYLKNPTGRLYAAWPGQYRTDLFEIDPQVMAQEMEIEVVAHA
jgi:hypothetical protein